MRVTIPLAGPSKQDRIVQSNSQRTINMYASVKDSGDSKSDLILYSHPGRKRISTVGIGPHRSNSFKWKGNNYWVSGSEVYKQDTSNSFTLLTGALLTSGSRVVFAGGRNYLMFVDGTYGYYTQGSSVTRITDADFPGSPTHVDYLDGYFIVNDADTDDFYIPETTEDPTAWAALDFATANARPDKGLALAVHNKDLYILGEDGTQIYFNSGNIDFPFDPYPGSLSTGIQAPHSVVDSEFGLIWLATNKNGDYSVVRAQGNQGEVLSDEEWTEQINKLSTTSDAIAWIRRQRGKTFYEITFPAAKRSWSYCIENRMLSELKSYGMERFSASGYGFFNGRHYIGNYDTGLVHELDFDTYTDDSESFIRTRRTRVFHKDGLSLSFRSLILDADAGTGLPNGQGSDPQVMFSYSVDGGRTMSSTLFRSMGAIGVPETKPMWNDLGEGYDWVFDFSFSDPTRFNLMNLYADVDVGRS
jgi:hypothetical protein